MADVDHNLKDRKSGIPPVENGLADAHSDYKTDTLDGDFRSKVNKTTTDVKILVDEDQTDEGNCEQTSHIEHSKTKADQRPKIPNQMPGNQKFMSSRRESNQLSSTGTSNHVLQDDKTYLNLNIPMEDGYKPETTQANTTLDLEDLNDLFNHNEQQVLYRVNMIIQKGWPIDKLKSTQNQKDSALHLAVKKKYFQVAKKLIENGADFLAKNSKSETPFDSAIDQQCDEMAALIIRTTKKPDEVRQYFGDDSARQDTSTCTPLKKCSCIHIIWRRLFACGSGSDVTENENYSEDCSCFRSAVKVKPIDTPNDERPVKSQNSTPEENKSINDSRQPKQNFFNILKTDKLKETVSAILDNLQEEEAGKRHVYVKILEADSDGNDPKSSHFKGESIFQIIAKQYPHLANHPAVRALVRYKWKKWAYRKFAKNTLLHFISFFALTFSAVVGAQTSDVKSYNSSLHEARAVFEVVSYLFALKVFFTELIQIIREIREYFCQFFNWLELLSSLLIIITLPLRYTHERAHWIVFGFGYLLWAAKCLKYAAVSRRTAAYAETLRTIIARDFLLFAVFFAGIELAFGGTFLLVLRGENELNVFDETSTIWQIWYTELRTVVEAGPQVAYNGDETTGGYGHFGQFLMLIFMVVSIVVMLNILIAQLSNTYETAQSEAKLNFWGKRASLIARLEKNDYSQLDFLPWFKYEPRKYYTSYLVDEIKDEMDKNETQQKLDDIQRTLKSLENKLVHVGLMIQTNKTKLSALQAEVKWGASREKVHSKC